SRADLSRANLSRANLSEANLSRAKNYSENNSFGIELCKRNHENFTQKEKCFIFEFIATTPCWSKIKTDFGKTALSVFKKLKDAGWGEYYDKFNQMLEEQENP
ncbi:MAG: pentapeptide repeat-containing protein, partial [Calditrichia bacterium]